MDSRRGDRELLAQIDRLNIIAAVFLLLLLGAVAYFLVFPVADISPNLSELLMSVTTNLITVPLLFILSSVAYRRIQAIRNRSDAEALSQFLAEDVIRKISHPSTRIGHLVKIEEVLLKLDIEAISNSLKESQYGGIVAVRKNLNDPEFEQLINSAREITVLNTWIPNLDFFADALVAAVNKGSVVRILMLYPNSGISTLRSEALRKCSDPKFRENPVRSGVEHCLDILSDIVAKVSEENRKYLHVKLYNSMPSISVYSVDERFFASVFYHGQLAIKSPQIEVQGRSSTIGKAISGEVETLWDIGLEFNDIRDWRTEVSIMSDEFNS